MIDMKTLATLRDMTIGNDGDPEGHDNDNDSDPERNDNDNDASLLGITLESPHMACSILHSCIQRKEIIGSAKRKFKFAVDRQFKTSPP